MHRLLCLAILAVTFCGCGGDAERQSAVSSTPPADSGTPPADTRSNPPADRETPAADIESPVEPRDTAPAEIRQPPADPGPTDSPADDPVEEETVSPPIAADTPPRGNRPRNNRPGDNKAAEPEVAELQPAFPSSLATVGLNTGDLIPEIEGRDVEGAEFKLSDYKGKVIMLDFWGDW